MPNAAELIAAARAMIPTLAARAQKQALPIFVGPRNALLASAAMSLAVSVLTILLPAFQFDNQPLFGYADQLGLAIQSEMAMISLMFAGLCAVSALLIGWRPLRWVTRVLLLLAGVFPAIIAVAVSELQSQVQPVPLVLFPIALVAPALLWGLWGTRQFQFAPARSTEPSAPVSPPPGTNAPMTPA